MDNYMKLEFLSKSVNEGFARAAVSVFASQLDITLQQLADIKTAVSEAVTNAIIHGYEGKLDTVVVEGIVEKGALTLTVIDHGRGIEDITAARQPLFTSRPDMERSGMGFTVMETFMDSVEVDSTPGNGTRITMLKRLTQKNQTSEPDCPATQQGLPLTEQEGDVSK